MSGYRSSFLRHRCDNSGCYIDNLPCWDDLIECFPRKIRPTDVDGLVEINGQILILEEKCAGAGPDEGQRRALRALAQRPGVTTVFFRPGHRSELEVLILGQGDPIGWQPRTREWFRAWLRNWSAAADGEAGAVVDVTREAM